MSLGGISLCLVISLDILSIRLQGTFVGRLSSKISSYPTFNLLSYEIPIPFIGLGLYLVKWENPNPLMFAIFPDYSIIFTILFVIFGFVLLNVNRFERIGLARRNEETIYNIAEELVEANENPQNGLETALEYINGCKKKFRLVDERRFLMRLSIRDDSLGSLAREYTFSLGSK